MLIILRLHHYLVSTATQSALNLKANLISPSLTGTPTINSYNIALKPWVSLRYIDSTIYNYGLATVNSVNTNSNSGDFDIGFTPIHPNGSNFGVIATVRMLVLLLIGQCH
jgi:hypothetical protein